LATINSAKKNLTSALYELESDSRSSRLNKRIDELGQEYKQMLKIEKNMEKIGKNIDYAINKFQEVDEKCAQALKSSSYNYRKSICLLTSQEKYGPYLGSTIDWGVAAWKKFNSSYGNETAYITNLPPFKAAIKFWNDNHIGAELYTGVELVVGVTTVVASISVIAAAPFSGGVSLTAIIPSAVALAHGINSCVSGVEDFNSILHGNYGQVGNNENYLQDGYKYAGCFIGDKAGYTIDKVTGSNTYEKQFSSFGASIGSLGYYGADIYFGNVTVKESLKILKDVGTVKNLSTTYEVGNWVDGYKVMRNLKISEYGASAAQKGYAALNGSSNAMSMVYDSKDGIDEIKNDAAGAWHMARYVLFGVQ
jgi:hypothetical protein